MRCPSTGTLTLVTILAVAVLALMGCPAPGELPDDAVRPPGEVGWQAHPDAPPVEPDLAAHTVEVTLTEYAIEIPHEVPTGTITFALVNEGDEIHSFQIEGQGISDGLPDYLEPGQAGLVEVTLGPGIYEVFCPIGDHAEQGMAATLTVTE